MLNTQRQPWLACGLSDSHLSLRVTQRTYLWDFCQSNRADTEGSGGCVCLCVCVCVCVFVWGEEVVGCSLGLGQSVHESVCLGCTRSSRHAGSHSNSQLKGVIESGGGEERDALREHLSPLSLTLSSSYLGWGDFCPPLCSSSLLSVVAAFLHFFGHVSCQCCCRSPTFTSLCFPKTFFLSSSSVAYQYAQYDYELWIQVFYWRSLSVCAGVSARGAPWRKSWRADDGSKGELWQSGEPRELQPAPNLLAGLCSHQHAARPALHLPLWSTQRAPLALGSGSAGLRGTVSPRERRTLGLFPLLPSCDQRGRCGLEQPGLSRCDHL